MRVEEERKRPWGWNRGQRLVHTEGKGREARRTKEREKGERS